MWIIKMRTRAGALFAPGADRNRVIVDRRGRWKKEEKKGEGKKAAGVVRRTHSPAARPIISLLNNWNA